MSVFTTKVNGQKVTVVAQNVAYVADNGGKGEIVFTGSTGIMLTDVGYDSVRRNVAKSLGKSAETDAE